MTYGIDVSRYQGLIDWPAVKAGGVEFAILQVGYSHYKGGLTLDEKFHTNAQAAIAAGIPIGVYVYAYDLTPEAARISAATVFEVLESYNITYPVWYDQEYERVLTALTRQQRTDICKAFCDEIRTLGYKTGIYASRDWFQNWLFDGQLDGIDKWVAAYLTEVPDPTGLDSGYDLPHEMWQYTVVGTQGVRGTHYWTTGGVAGVTGNCDVNVCYKDYAIDDSEQSREEQLEDALNQINEIVSDLID